MKVTYTTKNGRLTVEFEAGSQKEIFRSLSRFQEVFEDTAEALIEGKTYTSDDIRYIVRKSEYEDERGKTKEAEYFEKQIRTGPLAWFKKPYGVLDDGTDGLFPKKLPEEPPKDGGSWTFGKDGWHRYNKPK